MHVLFVEPSFPDNQRQFVRALHAVGARVTGIGEAPVEALDGELKSWLHGYEQVRSVVDEGALLEAVRRVQEREWVDRLEATVEAHIMAAAKVREACRHPRHERADGVPVPRQAGDEGGAARGRRPLRAVERRRLGRRSCARSPPRSASR